MKRSKFELNFLQEKKRRRKDKQKILIRSVFPFDILYVAEIWF